MGRIDNLTGVRAYAALWVFFHHYQQSQGDPGYLDLGAWALAGDWGVDLFFVLSGLILGITYAPRFAEHRIGDGRFRDFLVKRFARVYPLHLATFLGMAAIVAGATFSGRVLAGTESFGLDTGILNLLFVQGWGFTRELSWNKPSWSASTEWFAYLFLFPFCALALARARLRSVVAVVVALWLGLLVYAHAIVGTSVTGFTTRGILRIVAEFPAGYLLYRALALPRFGATPLAALSVATLVAVPYAPLACEALMLPAMMGLLLAAHDGSPVVDAVLGNSVVVFLGEISYSIYLTQVFVQMAGSQLLQRMPAGLAAEPALQAAVLLGQIALLIAVAAAAYYVIERPARDWLVARMSRVDRRRALR